MNTSEAISSNHFYPCQTQSLYSCKKNAWFLLHALKQLEPDPTINTLLEMASSNHSLHDLSPIDNLMLIYPYMVGRLEYKKRVLDFINQKGLDLSSPINRSKVLQFLAFCDGYPTWENMNYHLTHTNENLSTFSFVQREDSNELDVFVFFDNSHDPRYGQEIITSAFTLPDYDPKKLWGRATPLEGLNNLIQKLLCFIFPKCNDDASSLANFTQYLYPYFREIEQTQNEILMTERDIIQIINYEQQKESNQYLVTPQNASKGYNEVIQLISEEMDLNKKAQLAISSIKNNSFRFQEQLNIIQLFEELEQDTQLACNNLRLDENLHELIEPWVQYVCEQINFMESEIELFVYNDFSSGEGAVDLEDLYPYYMPTSVTISNPMYRLVGNEICIEADYTLDLEFDCLSDDEDNNSEILKMYPPCQANGSFEVEINRKQKITFVHSDISG